MRSTLVGFALGVSSSDAAVGVPPALLAWRRHGRPHRWRAAGGMEPAHMRVFVVGLESSGTRWLASEIARCIFAFSHHWNGAKPPCISRRDVSVSHISLPAHDVCRRRMPPVVSLNGSSDLCGVKRTPKCRGAGPWGCGRHFLNVSGLLDIERSRLVVVRRHFGVTRFSKEFMRGGFPVVHCKHDDIARAEMETGLALINQALQRDSSRVMVVDYDFMDDGWQWPRLAMFLRGAPAVCDPTVDIDAIRRVAGANFSDRSGEITRLAAMGLKG